LHVERFREDDTGRRLQPQLHSLHSVIDDAAHAVIMKNEIPQRGDASFAWDGHGGAIITAFQ
jgi:hypothetical protein